MTTFAAVMLAWAVLMSALLILALGVIDSLLDDLGHARRSALSWIAHATNLEQENRKP